MPRRSIRLIPPCVPVRWLARLVLAGLLAWPILPATVAGPETGVLRTARALEEGRPVRIVCFGDSVTGIYYHSGGRRAWSDLLGVALARIHPAAKVEIVNAGISGNTSADGLKRVDHDVLRHRPDLVVAMFGLNDMARVTADEFRDTLTALGQRIRSSGAELLLMTPNLVYPDDPRRPVSRLVEYSDIIHQVAGVLGIPVVDIGRTHAAIQSLDRPTWTGLMSDSIHPNLRGHKLFAEEAAHAITGRRVSLEILPELSPAFPRLGEALKQGKKLRIVAMKPYDELIGPALRKIHPTVEFNVVAWDPELKSIQALSDEAKQTGWWRQRNDPKAELPDLVVIAVPPRALAPDQESFYRGYTWILNWSQSTGVTSGMPGWDCLAVLPSVTRPELNQVERVLEAHARRAIAGQDIPCLERVGGDGSTPLELLTGRIRRGLAGATTVAADPRAPR